MNKFEIYLYIFSLLSSIYIITIFIIVKCIMPVSKSNKYSEKLYYIKGRVNGTYFNYINKINLSENKVISENSSEYLYWDISNNDLTFKMFEPYCLIKDIEKNITERIDDPKFCTNTKIIDKKNIEKKLDENHFRIFPLKNWKQNNFFITTKRYYFYQGVDSKGKCDKNIGFKSCGYLKEINCQFCVKIDQECPLKYKNMNDSNLDLNSFITHVDIFFSAKNLFLPEYNYYDNIYRNKDNIRHDMNNIEIIDKYNLYDFFKDNNILKSFYGMNNIDELKLIDVFLIKNNSLKIESEENIEKKYILNNFFSLIEYEYEQISSLIIPFYFLIFYYLQNIVFIFSEIYDENHVNFIAEVKGFYQCTVFLFCIYHIFTELLFFLMPNIYKPYYLKNYIFEGNLEFTRSRINIIKFLCRVSPYYSLINISLIIGIKLNFI